MRPVAFWGAGLLALAGFGAAVFGLPWLPTALLAGAGAGAAATGLWTTWRARPPAAEPPDTSGAAVLAAFAVTLMLVGSVFGQAFLLPGLGLLVLALAGLAGEGRA